MTYNLKVTLINTYTIIMINTYTIIFKKLKAVLIQIRMPNAMASDMLLFSTLSSFDASYILYTVHSPTSSSYLLFMPRKS